MAKWEEAVKKLFYFIVVLTFLLSIAVLFQPLTFTIMVVSFLLKGVFLVFLIFGILYFLGISKGSGGRLHVGGEFAPSWFGILLVVVIVLASMIFNILMIITELTHTLAVPLAKLIDQYAWISAILTSIVIALKLLQKR